MADYRKLAQEVRNRLNPDSIILEKAFSDELSSISYNDVLIYVRLAMKGVEPEYTQKSKDAGERVKEHLKQLSGVTFKYQGSVMTNTHIKGHSDIDLLTISDKFYNWDRSGIENVLNSYTEKNNYYSYQISRLENAVQSFSPYTGNYLDDLRKIRIDSEYILQSIYSQFDASNGKAIKIRNLSLKRDVDIVTASWYDGISSIVNNKGDYRGIQVYDKNKHESCSVDYPFLSIQRINERSSETNGRLKRMIRFLKNVKADSSVNIDLSSFDINAICYDIEPSKYQYQSFIELVYTIYCQLNSICTDINYSNKIVSVDGAEYVFRNKPEKIENIKKLLSEVRTIFIDLPH